MSNFRIEAYNSKNSEELLNMMEEFYEMFNYPYDRELNVKSIEDLQLNPDLGFLFMLFSGGTPVGYMALCFGFSFGINGRGLLLDEIYIRKSHVKMGLGKQCISFIDELAKKEGLKAVILEVENDNERAIQLYHK